MFGTVNFCHSNAKRWIDVDVDGEAGRERTIGTNFRFHFISLGTDCFVPRFVLSFCFQSESRDKNFSDFAIFLFTKQLFFFSGAPFTCSAVQTLSILAIALGCSRALRNLLTNFTRINLPLRAKFSSRRQSLGLLGSACVFVYVRGAAEAKSRKKWSRKCCKA